MNSKADLETASALQTRRDADGCQHAVLVRMFPTLRMLPRLRPAPCPSAGSWVCLCSAAMCNHMQKEEAIYHYGKVFKMCIFLTKCI